MLGFELASFGFSLITLGFELASFGFGFMTLGLEPPSLFPVFGLIMGIEPSFPVFCLITLGFEPVYPVFGFIMGFEPSCPDFSLVSLEFELSSFGFITFVIEPPSAYFGVIFL